ncbi:MAG: branched-chain amino acid ABC transporter permease [Alphaproteobacteria bacterium]
MASLALQLAVNAASLGAAYALMALGFVLVLNATTAVNFAHGDTVVAGGLLAVALAGLLPADIVVPGLVLLPAVLLATAALGALLGLAAWLPLADAPRVAVFVSTIAAGIVIANGLDLAMGAAHQGSPPLVAGAPVTLDGLTLPRQSLAILTVAGCLVALLAWLLGATQLGRRLRAAAEDPEMARALGIPVRQTTLAAFALAAALAGAAGLLLGNQFFVAPSDGGAFMLKAYIAVVIGGWGRLSGAVAGAFLIAAFEVGVAAVASHALAEGLLYATLFAVLAVRPRGLFGEPAGRRA